MTHEQLNDQRIAYYDSQKGGLLRRLVRRLTRWAWKPVWGATTNRMHERGLVNSYAYHEAIAYGERVFHAKKPAQPPNKG